MANEKKLSETVKELKAVVGQLQQSDFQVRQAFGQLNETLQAVISLLGEESVSSEVDRLRQERQQQQEAQMAAGIKVLVDEAVLLPAEAIGQDSLVVGTDTPTTGPSRRVQFEFRAIPTEMQEQFLGKKAGESVSNNGITLTISEVYTVDKAGAAAYQAREAAKAAAKDAPLPVDEATQKAIDESGDAVTGQAKLGEAEGVRNDPSDAPKA